jgi:hypothetical protein
MIGWAKPGYTAPHPMTGPRLSLPSPFSLLLALSPLFALACLKEREAVTETVEVDEQTHRYLEFAARMSGCTPGEVVARLVAAASMPGPPKENSEQLEKAGGVPVYADYAGYRTQARYNQRTKRIDITSGPLAGQSFKTPTGAARAIVVHYKPGVSPNRNGWSFWMVDDDSGRFLQSIRFTS